MPMLKVPGRADFQIQRNSLQNKGPTRLFLSPLGHHVLAFDWSTEPTWQLMHQWRGTYGWWCGRWTCVTHFCHFQGSYGAIYGCHMSPLIGWHVAVMTSLITIGDQRSLNVKLSLQLFFLPDCDSDKERGPQMWKVVLYCIGISHLQYRPVWCKWQSEAIQAIRGKGLLARLFEALALKD